MVHSRNTKNVSIRLDSSRLLDANGFRVVCHTLLDVPQPSRDEVFSRWTLLFVEGKIRENRDQCEKPEMTPWIHFTGSVPHLTPTYSVRDRFNLGFAYPRFSLQATEGTSRKARFW